MFAFVHVLMFVGLFDMVHPRTLATHNARDLCDECFETSSLQSQLHAALINNNEPTQYSSHT